MLCVLCMQSVVHFERYRLMPGDVAPPFDELPNVSRGLQAVIDDQEA